ncbi:MAG TPA: PQQ-binding-like beta-propeller repeat protein [Vicinamibacterales bacterium]|jgi:outer membrane protein assembly factor BamB|nr:PQQ-binding-like beta-propeller repeat protein [Vicinamibacterales bacterium]
MRKKSAVVVLAIALAAAGLYRFGGLSLARDGSGMWVRFFSSSANYDALEEDRARQRQLAPESSDTNASSNAPTLPAEPDAGNVPAERSELPRAAAVAAPVVSHDRSSDWTDFRGPNRDGRYEGPGIRADWPREGLAPVWKQPIGLGYASFVAADGRAFTIEQRRDQEVVSAYDIVTGRELWIHGWDAEFIEWQGGDGPRATPTYHEGRVYALGALGELRCLDARTGTLVWRRNILEDNGATNLEWGMSGSPLVVDDKVIVLPGGRRGRSVVAYNKDSGDAVWGTLDDQQAYTSPMLATLGGVRQIIIVSATRAVGLTVEEGRLLWEYPWVTQVGINVSQPIVLGGDRVFLSAGYGHGAAVFEVTRAGDGFSTQTVWQNTRMKNKFTSSVLHEGYIYGLDEAILACVEAATGELKWKAGRYGYGQIVLAGGHVIVLTEDGDIAVVRATPERHEEVVRFPAIEGKTWNHPIIAGGRLIVRNLREMAAFDLRP